MVVTDRLDNNTQPWPGTPEAQPPIPDKQGSRPYRWLRWNFGSIYRRLFACVFLANATVLAALLGTRPSLSYEACITAVAANVLAGLLFRNEHVVNLLFRLTPQRAPLWLRLLCANVYAYGGIHSACSVAATFWYVAYLVQLARGLWTQPDASPRRLWTLGLSGATLACLVAILVFAHPRIRVRLHDWFEAVHRFGGWAVVALFWAVVVLVAAEGGTGSLGRELAQAPAFWMLLLVTLLVVYPWLHLRRRTVRAERLSRHVVRLDFDYAKVHYGQAVRLSDNPLVETHAFAVIPRVQAAAAAAAADDDDSDSSDRTRSGATGPAPAPTTEKGFSVLVSNAGDWTRKMMEAPPPTLWTRGVPQYGVLRVAGLFRPVLVVATGSGIGPCLSLFVERPDHPVRIVWSTRDPVATYGRAVLDAVRRADPGAVVHDTAKDGRPDLVALAYRLWAASRRAAAPEDAGLAAAAKDEGVRPLGACEAVVVISNQKVTKKVVYGLESRRVPAYGAIFDS